MAPGPRSSVAVLALIVGLFLAPAAGGAAALDGHLAVSGKRCGQIDFAPGTDNVAAGIRASHIGCEKVRRHIRRLHTRDIPPGTFECRHTEHLDILSHTDHRCENGDKRFSWQSY